MEHRKNRDRYRSLAAACADLESTYLRMAEQIAVVDPQLVAELAARLGAQLLRTVDELAHLRLIMTEHHRRVIEHLLTVSSGIERRGLDIGVILGSQPETDPLDDNPGDTSNPADPLGS